MQIAKFMFYYRNQLLPPMFLSLLQEYPIAIDHITVVVILNNLQYSTKVLKFGILSQYRSLVWPAFLLLKERSLNLLIKWIRIGQAANPQLNYKHVDNRGGLPYKPGGFLEVSSPYYTVKPV